MKYLRFKIENYRGIKGPIEIDLEKHPLLPLVGLNESGKSSILDAVFAFDHVNDNLLEGRHLENSFSEWAMSPASDPLITAEIEVDPERLEALARENLELSDNDEVIIGGPVRVTLERNLRTRDYRVVETSGVAEYVLDDLGAEIVNTLPYITMFDDRLGMCPHTMELPSEGNETSNPWLQTIAQALKSAGIGYTVDQLAGLSPHLTSNLMEALSKTVNEALAEEWDALGLIDERQLLVEFSVAKARVTTRGSTRHTGNYLDVTVKEVDDSGLNHRFPLNSRSRGFSSMFSFALRVRFSNRANDGQRPRVLLFDEPASYLHTASQRKWCGVLKALSVSDSVIYATHSQYLLDPNVVPPRSIHLATRSQNGEVSLRRFYEATHSRKDQRLALQPVFDALEIEPYSYGLVPGSKVIVVEGIYDFYSFNMFWETPDDWVILPATGAGDVAKHVSYLIAWGIDFILLWDNDEEGRELRDKALEKFGSELGAQRFWTLPSIDQAGSDCRLEEYWGKADLEQITDELGLPRKTKFNTLVGALFFSEERERVIDKLQGPTSSQMQSLAEFCKTKLERAQPFK